MADLIVSMDHDRQQPCQVLNPILMVVAPEHMA